MIGGQLWRLTDSECNIVSHMTPLGVVKSKAPNTPIMLWPDESVCWPVTMWLVDNTKNYLDEKRRKGSRNKKGGTQITNASLLSFLVRYTFKYRAKAFYLLCDDDIKQWVSDLRKEQSPQNKLFKRRKDTQIGKIIRKGLSFLRWYQKMMLPDERLIGFDISNQITIADRSGASESYRYNYISHRHIPEKSSPSIVRPVGHSDITKLYDAIWEVTSNRQVQKRNVNILRLLEATGGRRVEVAELTVDHIYKAYSGGSLELYTAKSNDTEPREIPIAHEWIKPVILYIESFRKKLIKDLIKRKKIKSDPGYLFLDITNGNRLSEESITKLISILRREAGISHKVCAHMFRHRFITIQVATRLKGYTLEQLPMDVAHTILVKVAVLSGHSDPKSLLHYIDLAFEEIGVWDTSEKVLAMRSKLEGSYRQIQVLKAEVEDSNLSKNEVLAKVHLVLSDLTSEFESIDKI
jgi:integrase